MTDDEVSRLESIAQQFAARIHEEDPRALQRWLHAVTGPEEREALLYLLAAAVPTDRTWKQLTAWVDGRSTPEEQAMRRQALLNATARANGAGRRRAA